MLARLSSIGIGVAPRGAALLTLFKCHTVRVGLGRAALPALLEAALLASAQHAGATLVRAALLAYAEPYYLVH